MPWLTTHSATNKINDEKREDIERWSQWEMAAGGTVWYARAVNSTTWRYVGMTEAAADTCAAAMRSAGYIATPKRANDADGWTVEVTDLTYGTSTTSTTP